MGPRAARRGRASGRRRSARRRRATRRSRPRGRSIDPARAGHRPQRSEDDEQDRSSLARKTRHVLPLGDVGANHGQEVSPSDPQHSVNKILSLAADTGVRRSVDTRRAQLSTSVCPVIRQPASEPAKSTDGLVRARPRRTVPGWHPGSRTTGSSATCAPRRWSRARATSTGCARRASTRTPASRRWSATTSTAAGRCGRPCAVRETRQRYRGDTLILETEFLCDGGAVRVIDFMPIGTASAATSCASSRVSRARSRSRCCSTSASATAPRRRGCSVRAGRRVASPSGPNAMVLRGAGPSSQPTGAPRVGLPDGQEGRAHPAASSPGTRRTSRRPQPLDAEQALAATESLLARLVGPLHLPGAAGATRCCAR